MKIVNHTGWDTAQLRVLVQRVVKDLFTLTAEQRKELVVTFEPGRHGSGASGRCQLSRLSTVRVFIPTVAQRQRDIKTFWPDSPLVLTSRRSVAMVVAHEIMHGLGYEHNSTAMRNCPWYHDHDHEVYAWADALVIGPQPKRVKRPAADAQLAKAEAMAKKWRTKVKRDTTLLKKWEKKVKYYQKQVSHES